MSNFAYFILASGIISVGFLSIFLVVAIYTAVPDQDEYDTYDD